MNATPEYKPIYAQYITKRRKVQQITLVVPNKDWQEVRAAPLDDGWTSFGRQGPYTDKEMFPNVDPSRLMLNFEREVE